VTQGQGAAIWTLYGAWLVWLGVWVALASRVKPVRRRENLASRAAHILPIVLAVALFVAPFGQAWLGIRVLPRAAWMAYAGAALVLAGLGFAVWARLTLSGNWSGTVTLKHDHELIQTGPYAWARHPIYTGLLTAMLGNAIAADQVRGVLAFAIMTASFLWKMRTEEAFMRDAFGEKYTAYKQRVAALIPGVW
jgi:protein-S-isoprenylcysteine O-methyltransferase Ste14